MKRTRKVKHQGLGLAALGIMTAAASASAQTAPAVASSSPPPATSATEEWINNSKKPTDWMSWGADLRLRYEYVGNRNFMDSPSSDLSYFRIRSRLWTALTPVEGFSFNGRLTWEFRDYMEPKSKYNTYSYKGEVEHMDDLELDEIMPDTFNFKLALPDQPWALTVGRQDFMSAGKFEFGDGWLIGDGTPRDGSRTFFFDAARLTYDWKDKKTVFNVMYIEQAAEEDSWMPPISEQDYRHYISEQDERGVILYVSNKSLANTQVDGFFIYSHRNAEVAGGMDGDIYAFGMRSESSLGDHWKIKGQFAPEFGEINKRDVAAFGATAQAAYYFNDPRNNNLRAGIEYLTGDDPSTEENEAFDPLWGRWPQWSELLSIQGGEFGRAAYWSNMIRPNAGWSINPFKKTQWYNDYSAVFAAEELKGNAIIDEEGSFKGHFFRSQIRYTHNKHLMARLEAEYMIPGDYYVGSNDGLFIRAEIYLTY
jgi:hypothetical protein